ncbi:MATE family efflux transporter [Candidatus Soleaferrea massiliensis]|uniref:MATE family efflux transporter n=1 Tax=Candidatus Soleaferrea massiliensis TaxID=1470354 RepID=UPI00058E4B9C|nr:MATE family efflux transporter [Candidatus Soleaferrea massiliensis]
MKQPMDLTKGNVWKQLMKFALPLFLANLLQSLYGMVDMAVVGRYVGSAALAALSNATMIVFILTAVCIGVTMGGSVLVAQYRGARDEDGQLGSIGTLFALTGAAALVITVLSLLTFERVLTMMGLPAESMPHAVEYLRVICMGTVFVFGYNAVCSILRGMGDSKSPLYFVAVAAAVNVVLDFVLVGAAGMGTSGAAWATVLSQAVSFGVSLLRLRRTLKGFQRKKGALKPQGKLAWTILKIGLPSAVQSAVVNVAFLLVTCILNKYGVVVAAAAGVGLKVATFLAMPCWAAGQSVMTMVGQNMGAGEITRASSVSRAGLVLSLASTGIMVLFVQLFAPGIIGLFDQNPAVIREGVLYLRIFCSVSSFAYAAMYHFDSFATGVGAAVLAMVNALLEGIVLRLGLIFLFETVLGLGRIGVYLGQMLSTFPPAVIGLLYFLRGSWKCRRLIDQNTAQQLDEEAQLE